MKAAYLRTAVNLQSGVVVGDKPKPSPGPGELLIRVGAAGMTPGELLWYPTTHTRQGSAREDPIPGHEFSGWVESVDSSIHGIVPGRQVFGMNDWFGQGATAEYCIALPQDVTAKPKRLSHAEAASVPISALTAWQALFDRAKLRAGERVLVHGGAGSVGAYVIQLAKLHGAEVIATGTAPNLEFLRSIKADQVIDYRAVPFEQAITTVDVVFDAAGGDVLTRSLPLLDVGGRAVTVATGNQSTADPRTKAAFFIVEPNGAQLTAFIFFAMLFS
jgi:NADPH:quinone reductase-like Zn-dependent oxidoreductase